MLNGNLFSSGEMVFLKLVCLLLCIMSFLLMMDVLIRQNRDTSVLVRLRPAWEEIKSYLTTKDRKRFEVYVCTMAERDYALEMWRLLDPHAHLISLKELSNRVVCVRSG